MRAFAETCERIAATSKKTEKVRLLAELLRERPTPDAGVAAIFLSGRAFPAREETTLDVGGAILARALRDVAGADEAALHAAYRRHGDLGAAAHDLLAARAVAGRRPGLRADEPPSAPGPVPPGDGLALADVERRFRAIAAAKSPADKTAAVRDLLAAASPLEAKYLVKIITSDLRIGSKESLVEEAVAAAFGAAPAAVQRANMLLGDLGEVVRLASEGRLADAALRLFHPVAPMLASPAESADDAFAYCDAEQGRAALVEDKYDGIRAQAHVGEGGARIFSRTLDEITPAFPELVPELERFDREVILDGEVLAYRDGRALPFSELQKRLGRKRVTTALQREVPVAFVAFDVLSAGGALLIDRRLDERVAALDQLFAERRPASPSAGARGQLALAFEAAPPGVVLRAPCHCAETPAGLSALFDEARARGNEGLMVKDLASPYTPGRRGRAWLKLKRELATLDVVVTAVELGHGKRAGVLSDYTFAVREGDRLLNIGKAYSGLTDAEIAFNTRWFVAHTLEDRGRVRLVEPRMVIEVAFDAITRSDRHDSGFALRFPRIVRMRPDKRPEEIDTLEEAKAIFARQGPSRGSLP
jgi:DNA ligase-1